MKPHQSLQLKVSSFFKKKRGAPKKRQSDVVVKRVDERNAKKSKAGRNAVDRAKAGVIIRLVDAEQLKKKRRNYSKGDNYLAMKMEIEYW